MSLGLRVSRTHPFLKLTTAGLFRYIETMSAVGSVDTDVRYVPLGFVAPGPGGGTYITGMLQRAYLMTVGAYMANDDSQSGDESFDYFYVDNASLNSHWSFDDFADFASAQFENTLCPFKFGIGRKNGDYQLVTLDGSVGADTGAFVDQYAADGMFSWLSYQNASGGIAPGNRYDIYFVNVRACNGNTVALKRLALQSSVRVTFAGDSPIVRNVDLVGSREFSLTDKAFPVEATIEAFTGLNATGRCYGKATFFVHGGDVYTGSAQRAVTPGPPSAPISRIGWIVGASSSGGLFPPALAVDGDNATRWGSGATIIPGTTEFLIDTGAVQSLGSVSIDNSNYLLDNPSAGDVLLSDDGVSYRLANSWTVDDIAAGILTLSWIPKDARYVKLLAQGLVDGAPSNWFSIAEVNLYATTPA